MNDIKLVIKKELNAPIEKVWAAWTTPDQLKEWHSPEGMNSSILAFDLKVGGDYRIRMDDPKKNEAHTVGGTFKEVQPPHKLVYTWKWEGWDGAAETLVTIELKDMNGKTEMVFTHSGFPDENMQKEHNEGWSSILPKLETYLQQ